MLAWLVSFIFYHLLLQKEINVLTKFLSSLVRILLTSCKPTLARLLHCHFSITPLLFRNKNRLLATSYIYTIGVNRTEGNTNILLVFVDLYDKIKLSSSQFLSSYIAS
jgi:hypothetical protein